MILLQHPRPKRLTGAGWLPASLPPRGDHERDDCNYSVRMFSNYHLCAGLSGLHGKEETLSIHKMRSNGKKRYDPFPDQPSRDRTTVKPYRIWLKTFPKHPYIALVWATSLTQAIKTFAEYLTENHYRLARSSPGSYEGKELTPDFALSQKPPLEIGEKPCHKN